MLLRVCVITVCALLCAAQTTVSVNWNALERSLITVPAFQTVVNSLTTRVAPQHDAIFESIAQLGAQYQVFKILYEMYSFEISFMLSCVHGCARKVELYASAAGRRAL